MIPDACDVDEALGDSIFKWRNIVAGHGEDHGARNCALCQMFNCTDGCAGCPVAEYAGVDGCDNTPYEDWYAFMEENSQNGIRCVGSVAREHRAEAIALAQSELEYLIEVRRDFRDRYTGEF